MEKYADIVKKCSVVLYRENYSKIKIKCTAKSAEDSEEENIETVTTMKQLQTDTNTYFISVKRKNVLCEENSQKRIKKHHDVSTCK